MDLMLIDMKNNIFPQIVTTILPKVLTLHFSVHFEILDVIYWNSCVALNWVKENNQLTYLSYT